jgi:hypothetical protein
MLIVSNLFGRAIVVLAVLSTVLTLVEPAYAGASAVPAPLVGAGLPGLAVLGGVYGAIWLTRKLRRAGPIDRVVLKRDDPTC